jgi:xylulokinase
MDTLLAIDVGTTSLKATLYNTGGDLLAKETSPYPLSMPAQGCAEQNPQDWWEALCITSRLITGKEIGRLRGICITGQAPSCVPIDEKGTPLRPAILWLDRRSTSQVSWLQEHLGFDKAFQIGANTLDSYFGGVKWLWYRQNETENYDRTWKILQANGYLIYRLTGVAVTDAGHAGVCSPCFDIASQTWSETTCRMMDIALDKLPQVYPCSSVIGEITPSAAQATGLPQGIPVVCGSPDFTSSCLGSGAIEQGVVALMLGTAGNLMFPSALRPDARLLNTIHVTGSLLGCGGVLAGGAVTWFCEMLKLNGPDVLDRLEGEAAQVAPGSDGLVFLPYLMGERSPIWDAQAKGAYIGLTATHGRGHLYRSLLEGVAFAFRQLEDISKESGTAIREIIAINGGARSSLWRQILADVLEVPVRWRPTKDGTTLGGAYQAALGAGLFHNFAGISEWLEPSIDTSPNPSTYGIYRQNYRIYAGLYPKLREDFWALNN